MGAFTGIDDFINRMTGGNSGAPENLFFHKYLSTNGGSALAYASVISWFSGWRMDGIPNAGAVAGAVATCDKNTVGALQFTNSAGALTKRLVQGVGVAGQIFDNSPTMVLDRLLACGGLSGTVTTAQTVGGTLSRYTGGTGNQIWIEIQTAITGVPTTVTASYTNENGTAGRTTIARRIGASPYSEAHTAHQLPLQAGDKGVQSVQSVTLAASTTVAGNFAVVIYHPLTMLLGRMTPQGPFGGLGGLPEIVDDACITFFNYHGGNGLNFTGTLSTVDV